MAGARIPVWKRLGLKLKNEGQSGDPVPAVNGSHNINSGTGETANGHANDYDSLYTHEKPAQNGKSSKLGKQKYDNEPADVPEPISSSKKRKHSVEQEETNGFDGHSAQGVAITPVEGNGTDLPEAKKLEAGNGQPKGDPNYRKKKQKISSWEPREKGPIKRKNANGGEAHAPQFESSGERGGNGENLVLSTETHVPYTNPLPPKRVKNLQEQTPPAQSRRKSVTFTPDTKASDGNSAATYFKAWAAEQKQSGADFTSAEVAQFVPPPKVHPANGVPAPSQRKKVRAPEVKAAEVNATADGGKKREPSFYLSYLSEFCNSPETWKFNKPKQNALLKDALNVFRIPAEYDEALVAYIQGLQGQAADRLAEACQAAVKELNEIESTMGDAEARKAAHDEALKERVSKEKKRRRVESDIEELQDASDPDAYLRGLKRRRVEALFLALGRTAPIVEEPTLFTGNKGSAPPSKARSRKRRTEVSSDESSSDSSSDESSSDESSSSEEDSSDSSDSDSDSSSNSSDSSSDEEVTSKATKESKSTSSDESSSDSSDSDSD